MILHILSPLYSIFLNAPIALLSFLTLRARNSMEHYSTDKKNVLQKKQETLFHFIQIFRKFLAHYVCFSMVYYSLRIAAKGLNFIARNDGKKPAAMPTKIANINDNAANQKGM